MVAASGFIGFNDIGFLVACLLPVVLVSGVHLAAGFGWVELKPYTDPCAGINGTLRDTTPYFTSGGLMGKIAVPHNEIKYAGKHFYLCEVLTQIHGSFEPQLIAYNPEENITILAEETQK